MFTSDASNAISAVFGWIWSFINIRIPGLTVTLWQLAIGLFLFRVVWNIALGLTNTKVGGVSYRSTSYHKRKSDNVYDNWNVKDTDWNSDW